jgi:uncharacterized membrane protein
MPEARETEWSEIDRSTRARLRRAAFRGRAVDDPREAALVVAFARRATRWHRLQTAIHWVTIAALTALLVLDLARGRAHAAVYGALLALSLATLALFVAIRRNLVRAAELNESVASRYGT